MWYGSKKEVAVFTDFNKRKYGLYLGTILFENGEYSFDEWYTTEGMILSDINTRVNLYCYNGFPCGMPRKIYSKDYELMNSKMNEKFFKEFYQSNDICLPLEQLYTDAKVFGFEKAHIEAFINKKLGYWLYEDDKLIKKANSWEWKYE